MSTSIAPVQRVEIPDTMRPEVQYTPNSVKTVVIAIAHLLNHFADEKHPGLDEPQNKRRRMANTGVLVHPRQGGRMNLVGFQLFVSDPVITTSKGGRTHAVAVIFDMEMYEKMGDRYLFNMLKNLSQSIRAESRPDEAYLRHLSTKYLLEN